MSPFGSMVWLKWRFREQRFILVVAFFYPHKNIIFLLFSLPLLSLQKIPLFPLLTRCNITILFLLLQLSRLQPVYRTIQWDRGKETYNQSSPCINWTHIWSPTFHCNLTKNKSILPVLVKLSVSILANNSVPLEWNRREEKTPISQPNQSVRQSKTRLTILYSLGGPSQQNKSPIKLHVVFHRQKHLVRLLGRNAGSMTRKCSAECIVMSLEKVCMWFW